VEAIYREVIETIGLKNWQEVSLWITERRPVDNSGLSAYQERNHGLLGTNLSAYQEPNHGLLGTLKIDSALKKHIFRAG